MVSISELQAYCDSLLEVNRFDDYCPNGLQVEAGETVRAESELKRLTGAPSPELTRVLLALVGKANLPDVSIRLGFKLQRTRGERYDAACDSERRRPSPSSE